MSITDELDDERKPLDETEEDAKSQPLDEQSAEAEAEKPAASIADTNTPPAEGKSITGQSLAPSTPAPKSITADSLGGTPAAPSAPAASHTAADRLAALTAQGPPKYSTLKHILDTVAGATRLGSNIEEASGLGTKGYEARLGRAENAAKLEAGQTAEGEKEQQAQAELARTGAQTAEQNALAKQHESQTGDVIINDPITGHSMTVSAKDAPGMWKEITSQVGAGQRAAAAQTGATERNENTVSGANTRAASALSEKQAEFKSTDEYRRWKDRQDNQTKLDVAKMVSNKAPAALMETATFANGGLKQLDDAQRALADLKAKGVLGSWSRNKLEDALFGKGVVDPTLSPDERREIGVMRAALLYTSSSAMRAHTGRTSREIYDDFKTTMSPGQDLDALDGAMGQTRDMLSQYANAASDASIQALRSGTATAATPAVPGGPGGGGQGAGGTGKLKFGDWQSKHAPK